MCLANQPAIPNFTLVLLLHGTFFQMPFYTQCPIGQMDEEDMVEWAFQQCSRHI